MTLGERIQQLRKLGGFSQEQLAEAMSVSRQAISKWETDQSLPEIDNILLLSNFFNISTDQLLGNEPPVTDGVAPPKLSDLRRAGIERQLFTTGSRMVIAGACFLIVELLALFALKYVDMAVTNSFFVNA